MARLTRILRAVQRAMRSPIDNDYADEAARLRAERLAAAPYRDGRYRP